MSSAEVPILTPALRWHQATVGEWDALEARTRTRCKVVALVVVVAIAYHYSLVSLLQTIGLDTPLAYVGLVPLMAAGATGSLHAPPSPFVGPGSSGSYPTWRNGSGAPSRGETPKL